MHDWIDQDIMGFLSCLLGIIGFVIGIPIGLVVGFFIFIYFKPSDVKDPVLRKIQELETSSVLDILPEMPMWVKHPDYDRIDWLNKFVSGMWPYIDKATCNLIRSMVKPIFAEYGSMLYVKSMDFKRLSLGTLPPVINGIKVHETNEKVLVIDPIVRWAGNPDIILALKFFSLTVTVQLLDVQVFAAPRITLKPLVPSFPCFASIAVSLLEKPHVDFGLKLCGVDVMSIPGLYQFVQEQLRKQVASLYLWPQTLEIQILDGSVGDIKRPVGILHVKVVKALKLLKMDILGTSDPYVQLSLSEERLPGKRTSIKMKNLNPQWNEDFRLTVKDPQSQVLQLHVYDWEKVKKHDKLGMQVVPLRLLTPHETQAFTLDLVKSTNPNDPQNKKYRGELVVEMTFIPFKEDDKRFSGHLDRHARKEGGTGRELEDATLCRGGLLSVTIERAEDIEGKHHNNPYAVVMFRGERRTTKMIKKTRDPTWGEEFQFVLEEAPLKEKIHIEVMSKRTGIGFRPKEKLGYVEINLIDVVHNGRINDKYHLINSKQGVLTVDMRWKVV